MIESKLNGKSLDILENNIAKLKEIFPEIITEDKIDFNKFKQIFSNEIDDTPERYNFTWAGKSKAIAEAQKPSQGTLRPVKEESKDWDTTKNLYIEGDNLEVLKLLQKTYYGKIKMIYIDPPYNTGKDFVYQDNYKDNLENYLEMTGQVSTLERAVKLSTNPETSGRYHTNWLNMMYPRLKLARNLLTDEGVIFISVDDHESDNLRKICSEIFGEENFVTQMVWEQGKKSMATQVAVNHEYCLIYCKNRSFNIKYNREIKNFNWKTKKRGLNFIYKKYAELKESSDNNYFLIEKELKHFYKNLPENHPSKKHSHFNHVDKKGIYNPDNISQGTGKGGKFEIIHPKTNKPCKIPNGGWRFAENRLDDFLNENKIHFGEDHNTVPCLKRYLKDTEYEVVASVFYKDGRGASSRLNKLMDNTLFDYPKDEKIIEMFISLVTSSMCSSDIILDFFSGSGTTAHSVMQLNKKDRKKRRFIMVQIPEATDEKSDVYNAGYKTIAEIGKERIRRAGEKIKSESNNKDLDIGFKVFKLDSSNLNKWDPDFNDIEQTILDSPDNLVSGRDKLDLVYEIMLKYGLDLIVPIEEFKVIEKKIYSIGFGSLLVCLDENITKEIAIPLIELKNELSPETSRVVFKDNGFASDSDKTNIKETLKTNNFDEFITI
jgi:adenine-specific DNA-methyltransferase